MSKRKIGILVFLVLVCSTVIMARDIQWGWKTHEFINRYAIDFLPAEMSFFKDQADFLSAHSADPDKDDLPGYYHYIDIDYYPEFLQGTLPHSWADITARYGESVVKNNGTVPWVIEEWTEMFSNLMEYGDWNNAWQVAAELGHYVADSHQPLHLTRNYDGQYTGNNGIHSRYETRMMSSYLSAIPIPAGEAIYIDNVLDSVFSYIDDVYPVVDLIMKADDHAHDLDPNEGSLYYETLWDQLDSATIAVVQLSLINLASIWKTAWINAGRPFPPNSNPGIINVPADYSHIQAAIDAALEGDTILVQPGTYFNNLNFNGKNIVVGSLILVTGDTSYTSRTIIDGNHSNSVVIFANDESSSAVLNGFTITNGDATVVSNPNIGGGISCDHSSPTLKNLIIKENTAYNGGGINISGNVDHTPLIQNVQIINNSANRGGGIYCIGANPIVQNTIIRNNESQSNSENDGGGGLYLSDCSANFDRVLIFRNISSGTTDKPSSGGGIYLDSSAVQLTNIVLYGNSSDTGPGLFAVNSSVVLTNSVVWRNDIKLMSEDEILVAFSIVQDGPLGIELNESDSLCWFENNLDSNPLFENPEFGDFRLQTASPCINSGTALFLWQDDTLVSIDPDEYYGSAPDIGFVESAFVSTIDKTQSIPRQFILLQNFPNPFNATTNIRYEISSDQLVILKIFNISGQEVSVPVNNFQKAGAHTVNFDASSLSAGIYFYLLEADGQQVVRRMVYLK